MILEIGDTVTVWINNVAILTDVELVSFPQRSDSDGIWRFKDDTKVYFVSQFHYIAKGI